MQGSFYVLPTLLYNFMLLFMWLSENTWIVNKKYHLWEDTVILNIWTFQVQEMYLSLKDNVRGKKKKQKQPTKQKIRGNKCKIYNCRLGCSHWFTPNHDKHTTQSLLNIPKQLCAVSSFAAKLFPAASTYPCANTHHPENSGSALQLWLEYGTSLYKHYKTTPVTTHDCCEWVFKHPWNIQKCAFFSSLYDTYENTPTQLSDESKKAHPCCWRTCDMGLLICECLKVSVMTMVHVTSLFILHKTPILSQQNRDRLWTMSTAKGSCFFSFCLEAINATYACRSSYPQKIILP